MACTTGSSTKLNQFLCIYFGRFKDVKNSFLFFSFSLILGLLFMVLFNIGLVSFALIVAGFLQIVALLSIFVGLPPVEVRFNSSFSNFIFIMAFYNVKEILQLDGGALEYKWGLCNKVYYIIKVNLFFFYSASIRYHIYYCG